MPVELVFNPDRALGKVSTSWRHPTALRKTLFCAMQLILNKYLNE
jgi:hypothetical protein